MLKKEVDKTFKAMDDVLTSHKTDMKTSEIGTILSITGNIIDVAGLNNVKTDELVEFSNGTLGLATNLMPDVVGIVSLGSTANLSAGDQVKRTGRIADVPV